MRPYLYAQYLLRVRSQEESCLERDTLLFEKISNVSLDALTRSYLIHPLIPLEGKIESICTILGMESTDPDRALVTHLLKKNIFKVFPAIFSCWKDMVEDVLNKGIITVRAQAPLSKESEQVIINMFQKYYPQRKFGVRYELSSLAGYTARFRDAFLDQTANTILKKIILSLKEGF